MRKEEFIEEYTKLLYAAENILGKKHSKSDDIINYINKTYPDSGISGKKNDWEKILKAEMEEFKKKNEKLKEVVKNFRLFVDLKHLTIDIKTDDITNKLESLQGIKQGLIYYSLQKRTRQHGIEYDIEYSPCRINDNSMRGITAIMHRPDRDQLVQEKISKFYEIINTKAKQYIHEQYPRVDDLNNACTLSEQFDEMDRLVHGDFPKFYEKQTARAALYCTEEELRTMKSESSTKFEYAQNIKKKCDAKFLALRKEHPEITSDEQLSEFYKIINTKAKQYIHEEHPIVNDPNIAYALHEVFKAMDKEVDGDFPKFYEKQTARAALYCTNEELQAIRLKSGSEFEYAKNIQKECDTKLQTLQQQYSEITSDEKLQEIIKQGGTQYPFLKFNGNVPYIDIPKMIHANTQRQICPAR